MASKFRRGSIICLWFLVGVVALSISALQFAGMKGPKDAQHFGSHPPRRKGMAKVEMEAIRQASSGTMTLSPFMQLAPFFQTSSFWTPLPWMPGHGHGRSTQQGKPPMNPALAESSKPVGWNAAGIGKGGTGFQRGALLGCLSAALSTAAFGPVAALAVVGAGAAALLGLSRSRVAGPPFGDNPLRLIKLPSSSAQVALFGMAGLAGTLLLFASPQIGLSAAAVALLGYQWRGAGRTPITGYSMPGPGYFGSLPWYMRKTATATPAENNSGGWDKLNVPPPNPAMKKRGWFDFLTNPQMFSSPPQKKTRKFSTKVVPEGTNSGLFMPLKWSPTVASQSGSALRVQSWWRSGGSWS